MKNLFYVFFISLIAISCNQKPPETQAPEAEAPSLYIEWYGDNEVANEMVTRGMEHVMNVEFDKSFVFFEAATQLDSTLFGPHVMLAQFSNANSENEEFHYARAKALVADKNVNSKLFVSLLDEKNEKGKRQVLGADNHIIWKKMYENEPRGGFMRYWYTFGMTAEEGAEDALLKMLEDFKSDGRNYGAVLNNLGYFYMKNENMDKAKEYFERYCQTRPDGYNSHDSMGEYYFNNKDYENSLLHYQMALDNYPAANNAQKMISEITALMK